MGLGPLLRSFLGNASPQRCDKQFIPVRQGRSWASWGTSSVLYPTKADFCSICFFDSKLCLRWFHNLTTKGTLVYIFVPCIYLSSPHRVVSSCLRGSKARGRVPQGASALLFPPPGVSLPATQILVKQVKLHKIMKSSCFTLKPKATSVWVTETLWYLRSLARQREFNHSIQLRPASCGSILYSVHESLPGICTTFPEGECSWSLCTYSLPAYSLLTLLVAFFSMTP